MARVSARAIIQSFTLERRCRRRLAALPFTPELADLNAFCRQLGDSRGRPIQLVPIGAGGGTEAICGWTLPLPDRDLICVKTYTTEWHQRLIVCHECSHLICNHEPTVLALRKNLAELFPAGDWDFETVGERIGVRLKSRYDEPEEREAERLADLLMIRAPRRAVPTELQLGGSPEAVELLNRFARALRSPAQ